MIIKRMSLLLVFVSIGHICILLLLCKEDFVKPGYLSPTNDVFQMFFKG
jgi:hypothetical protein